MSIPYLITQMGFDASGGYAPVVTPAPVKMILDTDMETDIDDMCDLVLAISLHKKGVVDLLAVMCTGDADGAVAARLILDYYGLTTIPVGKLATGYGGSGMWVEAVRAQFDPTNDYSAFPLVSDLYQTVLTAQTDNSVSVVTTGFATPLLNAYNTHTALFQTKVKDYVFVAGIFPASDVEGSSQRPAEYNIEQDKVAWSTLSGLSETIYWAGIELANLILVTFPASEPSTNPAKWGWDWWHTTYGGTDRAAWGQMGVLYAAYGSTYYNLSAPGRNVINTTNGANAFEVGAYTQHYLTKAVADSVLEAKIEQEFSDANNT